MQCQLIDDTAGGKGGGLGFLMLLYIERLISHLIAWLSLFKSYPSLYSSVRATATSFECSKSDDESIHDIVSETGLISHLLAFFCLSQWPLLVCVPLTQC
jgi:hypothetical protein